MNVSNVDFSLRRALNVELDSLRLSSFSSLRLCVNLNLRFSQSRKAHKTVRRKAARGRKSRLPIKFLGARKRLLIRERGVNMQPSNKHSFSETSFIYKLHAENLADAGG